MDKLFAIQTFVRVAETGSFSAVAKELGSSQSSVSKNVAALEKDLCVKLLSRTTRSISLTEEGERYFEQVSRLVAEIQDAESTLKKGAYQLSGVLRVAASVAYGKKFLIPLIDQFLKQHTEVKIDLNLSDDFVDIVEQGIDVAIRIGELADSSLLARRIGTTQRALVASKSYIEQMKQTLGLPEHPAELAQYQCIIYTALQSRNVWEFSAQDGTTTKVRVNGNFQSNSSEAIREAGLRGLGICYSPIWLFEDALKSGEMAILMQAWTMRPLPIQVVYPAERKNSAKVRAFIEYLSGIMT